MTIDIDHLRHARMGHRARALVIASADGPVQVSEGGGRVASWVQRKAAHMLGIHGIVSMSRASGIDSHGRCQPGMMHATITPLGREVLSCYAYQFEHGTRLHWRKLRRWLARKREHEQLCAAIDRAEAQRAAASARQP